jgi:hypothetical protein
VATNFGRSNGGIFNPIFRLAQLAAISPQISAQAITYLAASPDLEGACARYYNRDRQVRSSDISYDMNTAKGLWDASLALSGLARPAEAVPMPGVQVPGAVKRYR